MDKVNVNDETAFILSSEKFIYELQRTFRRIFAGLEAEPLLHYCLKLEDLIYRTVLEDNEMQNTANVWNDENAILGYQEMKRRILKNFEFRASSNVEHWKKIYEANKVNPLNLFNELLKDDNGKKINPKSTANRKVKSKSLVVKEKNKSKKNVPNKFISVIAPAMAAASAPASDMIEPNIDDDPNLFNDIFADSLIDEKSSNQQAWENKTSSEAYGSNASKGAEVTKDDTWQQVREQTLQQREAQKRIEEERKLREVQRQKDLLRERERNSSGSTAPPVNEDEAELWKKRQEEEAAKLQIQREIERKKREEEEKLGQDDDFDDINDFFS